MKKRQSETAQLIERKVAFPPSDKQARLHYTFFENAG